MKPIIFTDLDGTLLDYADYSFEKALPALSRLKEKDIPLVICSSKTKREIEYYREKIGNVHPFISENGGGIFIPAGYFDFKISAAGYSVVETQNYQLIRLGAEYTDLRKALTELRREGFPAKGFGDMSAEEISLLTNLDLDEAYMAKERDFDEPFIFDGNEAEAQKLIGAVKAKGFMVTEGRFFHILGKSDKGKAVSILTHLYQKQFDDITTIAIGDSPNDIPMLESVEKPVIVRKADTNFDRRIDVPGLIKADGIGPEGWNQAVLALIAP